MVLMDEPTNHLDEAAVHWLCEHLTSLERAAVVIVSHDYEFLRSTITDVMHMADMTISYFPDGWQVVPLKISAPPPLDRLVLSHPSHPLTLPPPTPPFHFPRDHSHSPLRTRK